MCGTVGMFLGCEAMQACFLHEARLRPGDEGASGGERAGTTFKSPLDDWDRRASVRATPRRVLGGHAGAALPKDMVPVARHEVVAALPESAQRSITLQHVLRYLDFTAKLELVVVNRTLTDLAVSPGFLSRQHRLDAHKMLCDEAYHALVAFDLGMQLEDDLGEASRAPETPYFLQRLSEIVEHTDPSRRALIRLLFVVVSETLISGSLAQATAHARTHDIVRAALRDHAMDEGRHHAFFAMLLPELWAILTVSERSWVGPVVPRLIDVFLAPDRAAVADDLMRAGVAPDDAARVLLETFDTPAVGEQRRSIASRTLGYFAELGAFDSNEAAESLQTFGMAQDDRPAPRPRPDESYTTP